MSEPDPADSIRTEAHAAYGTGVSQGARGAGISIVGQAVKLVTQACGVVVLSRLLGPADFGIMAMVTVFVALTDMLRDFGLPTAALRAPVLSCQQASNMFWLNSALGLTGGLVLLLLGPLLMWIYSEPRVLEILPMMAAVSFLNGMQAQVQVQLLRAMRFRFVVASDVVAQLCGLSVAVVAAMLGAGLIALGLQVISAAFVLLTLRWVVLGWRPSRPRGSSGSKELIRTGMHFGFAQFLSFAASNIDTLLIGARWGPVQLGYYNRGFQLLTAPIARLVGPLSEVAIPTMRAAEAEGRDLGPLLLRAQFLVGLVSVAIFSSSAAASQWLIPWMLGEQWSASVPVFNALAVGGCFIALSNVSLWAFIVMAESRQLLFYNLVTKTITVAALVVASTFGIVAVAWTGSICLGLSWPINLLWLRFSAGLRFWDFFKGGLAVLAPGALSYAATSWLMSLFAEHITNWGAAFVAVPICVSIFIGLVWLRGPNRTQLRWASLWLRSEWRPTRDVSTVTRRR